MKIEDDNANLQLDKNQSGILACRGRIQGNHPKGIPSNKEFPEKLVMNAHLNALHGRVVSTMTGIRVKYWIPRLQQLVKRVRKRCYGCNRFQTVIFQTPPLVLLPRDHSECDKFFKL